MPVKERKNCAARPVAMPFVALQAPHGGIRVDSPRAAQMNGTPPVTGIVAPEM